MRLVFVLMPDCVLRWVVRWGAHEMGQREQRSVRRTDNTVE
jgi:hypothetical protein